MRIRLFVAVALLCGCGEVVADHPPDAEAPDAEIAPDAFVPDADLTATASAVVHAHYNGAGGVAAGTLMEGITILSVRPDGSVAGQATTDASGAATFDIWPGGSVTAIYPHANDAGHELVTFVGVKAGDTLDFGSEYNLAAGTVIGTLTASWPTLAGMTYAYASNNYASCGASPATYSCSLSFYDYTPSPVDVYYEASGASGVLRFGYLNDVTVPGGSAAMGFWQSFITAPMQVSGLPPEVNYAELDLSGVYNNGQTFQTAYVGGTPTGGAYTGSGNRAQTGDRAFGQLYLQRTGNWNSQRVLEAMTSNTSQWTVASPAVLPWVSGVLANASVRYLFVVTYGATPYDATGVRINWSHYDPIAGTSYGSKWNIYMAPLPEGMNAIPMPVLPEELADLLPTPDDSVSGSVQLMEIMAADGYDDIRATPERQLINVDQAVRLGSITHATVSGGSL